MRKLAQKSGIATGILAALLASTVSASATLYDWTLSGGGDTGSGSLTTTGAADGTGFDVLSFDGTIDGNPVSLAGGQPGPLGASGDGGVFFYDNIVYPSSNPGTPNCSGGNSVVDGCGIFFTYNGTFGNIWINYSGSGVSGTGPDVFSTPTYSNGSADFTIAQAPEPLTLSLLGAGLFGAAAMRRRKAKR